MSLSVEKQEELKQKKFLKNIQDYEIEFQKAYGIKNSFLAF